MRGFKTEDAFFITEAVKRPKTRFLRFDRRNALPVVTVAAHGPCYFDVFF